MKRIAIISPSELPIPSLKGGAIETLTTYIVNENEKNKLFEIDVAVKPTNL